MTAPAQPSRTAWRPSSPGNRSAGRNRRRSRRSGISRHSASTTTPSVVPTDRVSSPAAGEAGEVGSGAVDARVASGRRAITVTLDSSGAITGQANRWWACSTPVSTMPDAVERQLRREDAQHARGGLLVLRAARPAAARRSARPAARPATASGTSSASTQVSSAEVTALTRSRSPAATAPASSGTTRLARAPPATSSKTMFGMVLAAL